MQYKAPLRDMKFVMHELLKFEDHYKTDDQIRFQGDKRNFSCE